jgi:hypothetical protein
VPTGKFQERVPAGRAWMASGIAAIQISAERGETCSATHKANSTAL